MCLCQAPTLPITLLIWCCLQVFCLKAVRAMERGDEWVSDIYDNYSPETSEVRPITQGLRSGCMTL